MSWKNMTFGKKIAFGFAVLILITVMLGGLGAWWMKSTQKESEMLAQEYVPELTVAAEIRGAANRLMYQMRGYGFTENEQYYQNALKEIETLNTGIEKGNNLAQRAVHLEKLGGQLTEITQEKNQYHQSMQDTLDTTGLLAQQRDKLDENAAKYMQNSNDFLAGQNKAFKQDLNERQKKVDIVTDIVGLGTQVRVTNFKAQATDDMALMQQAVTLLDSLKTHTGQLRPITTDAEDIQRINAIEAAADKYAQNMSAFIATDSKMDAAGEQMDASAALYMQNCNDFLASQNEAMRREFNQAGADLTERLEKITLINDIIDLGNAARIANFKAQATQDAALMQTTIEKFTGVKKITADLRRITRKDVNRQQIDTIASAADGYLAAMKTYLTHYQAIGGHRDEMDASAAQYVSNCETFLDSQQKKLGIDMHERHNKITLMNDIIDLGNDTRIKAYKSQALRDPAIMEAGEANFQKIDAKFADIRKITRLDADLARLDKIQAAGAGYLESMKQFLTGWQKLQEIGQQREILGNQMIDGTKVLQEAAAGATEDISKTAAANLSTASTTMIIGLVTAFVVGTLLAFFIARGIINILKRITSQIDEGSDQVASASGQVSSSSQSLAEGASEQAASIEETSSSLEEMSSMTKQNADNATEAKNKMAEARSIVEKVDNHMGDMATAIQDITKSSEETGKIIKTIDEIAFQTNLLALNAAVEAARAGEAGAGFAVVADEVRNLAMRAAEAAKNTADLIENTIKSVKNGNELTEMTQTAFKENIEISAKVGELVDEIAAASQEQAKGIDQVNIAVGQMDKVTQQNAANAEESASAAEEMNAQAEQMKSAVGELMKMVGGSNNGARKTASPGYARSHQTSARHAMLPSGKKNKSLASAAHQANEVNPEQLIPMDDEDFRDF